MLIILAFLCFLAAAIYFGITRGWGFVLIAAGLAFWVLDAYGPIKIG
jgi:hypothetical protein